MATPGNVLAFYAEKRWGNRHGIKGPLYGAAGHRGHDIKTAAREAVPALRGGKVAYVGKSSVLGPVVVIEVGPSNYDGYAHLYGVKVSVGDHVAQGAIIALTAGVGDYHGSAWLGPHLHITNGPLSGSVYAGATRDPAPGIRDVLAAGVNLAPAGTPSKPAAPVTISPAPSPTNPVKAEDVFYLIREVGPGSTGRIGLVGGKNGFRHIGSMDEVNALIVGSGYQVGQYPYRQVNAVEFDRMRAALTTLA
jgi:hypothetical protein